MTDVNYMLAATAIMCAVTVALRGFVFVAFSGKRKPPHVILYIGSVIGPAIIAALIVYCMKNTTILAKPYGFPELMAVLTCTGLHIWKRNPLVSIIVSTVVYMILLQNLT